MTDRIKTEHEEQREFVQWVRQTYKHLRIFAIPNGGHRGRAQAGRLKAEGVSAGVPDLYIPALRLWVEMKRSKGGSLSPDQKDWINYLRSIGDNVAVCAGCQAAIDAVENLMDKHPA